MKEFWKKLSNILKLIFLFIANFFLLFFPEEKKKTAQDKEKKNESLKEEKKLISKEEDEESGSTFATRNLFEEYRKKSLEEEIEEIYLETLQKSREPREIIEELKEEKKEIVKEIKKHFEKEQISKKEYKEEIKKIVKEKIDKKKEGNREKENIKTTIIDSIPLKEEKIKPPLPKVDSPKIDIEKKEELPKEIPQVLEVPKTAMINPSEKEEKIIFSTPEIQIPVVPVIAHEKEEAPPVLKQVENLKILEMSFEPEEELEEYEQKELALDNKLELLSNTLLQPLTEAEKIKVKKEMERTKEEQAKVKKQKEENKKEEEKDLEETIRFEEKEELKKELKRKYYEEQIELEEKLKDIDKKTTEQRKEIERQMIKEKVKASASLLEVPALISLPFIKNKYFRSFVVGLFVANHLNFVKRLLFRETKRYQEMDLSYLKQGSDALEHALLKNQQNILSLQQLEQEIYLKYPELKEDEEFLKYMEDLKINLYLNEQKLIKKQKKTIKYLHRGPKRVLKRKGGIL